MEDGALDNKDSSRGSGDAMEQPRIILAKGLLEPIYEYVAGFQQLRGKDIETGGMLTGQFAHEENGSLFTINGFIGAGPNADCSEESVLFDTRVPVARTASHARARAADR